MNFIKEMDNDSVRGMEFSAGFRWQHWIRAFSIFGLIITGFYLADPFITYQNGSAEPTRFLHAEFREWHVIFGFVMTGAVLYKTFYTLFFKEGTFERKSLKDSLDVKMMIQQVKYYLLISKHPHTSGVYNPLQFWAYTTLYVLFYGLIITGFTLYAEVFHNGFGGFIQPFAKFVETAVGGLAYVRILHHVFMWGIIIVVFVHIYMAIYNAIFRKNGGIDAIVSGMKWEEKEDKENHKD